MSDTSISVTTSTSTNIDIGVNNGTSIESIVSPTSTNIDIGINDGDFIGSEVSSTSTIVNIGTDENSFDISAGDLVPHAATHINGGNDQIDHNLLVGLQGGSENQFYHLTSSEYLNLITGNVVRPTETGNFITNSQTGNFVTNNQTGEFITNSQTGQFYASSNPSGFITGVNLTNVVFTTGNQTISGTKNFNVRPTVSTIGVVLVSETGQFYPRSNPSGYITGLSNVVYTIADQTINGTKNFTTRPTVNGTGVILTSETGQFGSNLTNVVFTTGNQTISGTKNFNVRPTVSTTGVVLISETGQFYPRTNPSGYITGNAVFITGNQIISGQKTFDSGPIIRLDLNQIALKTGDGGNSIFIHVPSINANRTYTIPDVGSSAAFVLTSGPQTISGVKNFTTRPTVSGTGVLLEGESLSTGVLNDYVNKNETGQFYSNSNPSGFITGIDLSSYATQTYVTGISGELQTQITTLNNQTGSFYLNSNPSGYITGVDLSFSGNYYTKDESESRYVNTTGAETILGDKTFHDRVYINNLYVTGLETIVNTTNTNIASNYIMLNLTGGAVDGGIFFVTGSGLTGINDSGAIIGFDHSDKFKFGIGTRASDLSILNTIAAYEQVTGISGSLQVQITTLNSVTGDYVLKSETGNFITNSQTGNFYAANNPSGYITGVDLSNYVTTSSTGSFLTTGIADERYVSLTSSQVISGVKTFATGINVTGNVNIQGDINTTGNLAVDTNVLFVDSSSNRVGIGTVTPIAALEVNGTVIIQDDAILYGDQNTIPNQTLNGGDGSIITKVIGDVRYLEKNPVTTDTLLHTTEQFEDFDKYLDAVSAGLLNFGTASGTPTLAPSQLFGNTISPGGGFTGNDRYTWNGALLVRGPTASNQALHFGLARCLNSDLISGTEITFRFMLNTASGTQQYFKIGPVPWGGTGGGDQALRGGLLYSPGLFGNTNLYIAAHSSTGATPFTFTTTLSNVNYVDTGFDFAPYLNKWINITYKYQNISGTNYINIIIKRDNVVLYSSGDINLSQAPYNTWTNVNTLHTLGASKKLGFAWGNFTYSTRQELYLDYIHEKVTHSSSWTPPSNWNSLRF